MPVATMDGLDVRRPSSNTGLFLVGVLLATVPLVAALLGGAPYLAASLSIAGYFAAVALAPTLRPTMPLVSPGNAAAAVWLLVLVVFPLSLSFVQPAEGALPYLPSAEAINRAILVNLAGFAAFLVGNQLGRVGTARRRAAHRAVGTPPIWVVGLFAAVGVIGIGARFGSVDVLLAYLTGSGQAFRFGDLDGLRAALATLAPPFLSFAAVLGMQRWRDGGRLRGGRVAIGCALTLAPLSVYSYNRGAFVVPLFGLIGALGLFSTRRRPVLVAAGAVGLLALALAAGDIRNEIVATQGGRYTVSQVGLDRDRPSTWETIQAYGQAPQFTAFALSLDPPQRFPGDMLLSSLLSPVPMLGADYREAGGTAAYNLAIYHTPRIRDQIVPLTAEAWWSLGPFGVLAVFALVGFLLGRAHRTFAGTASFVVAYSAMTAGVWLSLAMITSALVVSQVFLSFFWPQVVYGVLTALGVTRRRHP